MTKHVPRVMVVGPTIPLIGGISTYIDGLLKSKLNAKFDFICFSTNHSANTSVPCSDDYGAVFSISFGYLLKCIVTAIYHILKFPIVVLKNKPDIIHIHTSSYLTFFENFFYILISKVLNKKVILHIHSGDFDIFYRKSSFLVKKVIKYILYLPDKILCLSLNCKMFLINEMKLKKDICTIYNGYDSSIFNPVDLKECRKLLNLPYDKFIILTVGNLLEVKGHKYLVEAISEVVLSRQDVLCIIVGDGLLKDELNVQVKSAGLENYVKLVGGKPHHTIPLWMNAANLFVLSSLNEGNPIVMLESLGVGLPFIGTRVGAIPEIISSEDYGFLVNSKDSKDLANKISAAINKKWDKLKIINYSNNFKWDSINNCVQNLYMSLLT